MDINRLLSDELSYELLVRNLPTQGTVADKRVLLRNAIRLERSGSLPSNSPADLQIDSEIAICSEKLENLNFDMEHFDFANKDNEYKRIFSRLVHVGARIKRIPITEGHREIISELTTRSLLLVEKLTEIYTRNNREADQEIIDELNKSIGSVIDDPNPILPQVMNEIVTRPMEPSNGVETVESDSRNKHRPSLVVGQRNDDPVNDLISFFEVPTHSRHPDANTIPSNQDINSVNLHSSPNKIVNNIDNGPISCPSRFMHPLYNVEPTLNIASWNITFNGESSSVMEFLQRVEEIRLSRGVSTSRLYKAVPELLRGTALNWYRSETIECWEEFVKKLKAYFLPYDYEFTLQDEIRKRSQGSSEKVIVFIANMQNLFNKLTTKPSEATRVALIRRNLLPYIQRALALQSINTVEQLTKLCRSVEETSIRAQQYNPPSTSYKTLLEPQLAYHKPVTAQQPATYNYKNHEQNSSRIASVDDSRTRIKCWNCNEIGHSFRKCKLPRQKFCFKCGFRNVISRECPKCQGNDRPEH